VGVRERRGLEVWSSASRRLIQSLERIESKRRRVEKRNPQVECLKRSRVLKVGIGEIYMSIGVLV
jgi:hypothetical protein